MKKLKTFLLRYDPPGVGLEVEEDGVVDVRHTDLPPASTIISVKEISALVDRLISEEPDLLSKRRHRPALLQLLCRLYKVSIDEGDAGQHGNGEGTSPNGKGSDREDGEATSHLQEGMEICLIGLKGKLQSINGELGILTRVHEEKGKFEIALREPRGGDGQENIKVRGAEHLVQVAAKGTPFAIGSHVVIRGLRNHTELNGCLGRIVECFEDTQQNHPSIRFEVRATESGQLFRVKKENLVNIEVQNAKENREPNVNVPHSKKDALPMGVGSSGGDHVPAPGSPNIGGGCGDEDVLEAGSIVELAGLKTAMVYNGQQATVLTADTARGRYEIKLADGAVKTIRAENVRLVSAPNKSSPRTRRGKEYK
eukprot:TRINITY_DN31264_c0_g1_i1.p1 TRINITY_DN31264_c0_g1~~TRINITY_DN31264_c0_g1_i1.p1  ORF type:complete len:387 (-),score=64.72 TRINITY_DN31264_c0_g1_i1:75-1178(-)